MAGIAGVVYSDSFHANRLMTFMLDTLSYRGRSIKESQLHTFRNMQVGICGGTIAVHKNIYVGLDGTIYNHNYLRPLLQEHGYDAILASDASLIAFAYELWGEKFLTHIDGDFAFFLLDQDKAQILLARDRIGKKPLYWFHSGGQFIFASELKGLLASGAVPQTTSNHSLATYLFFGYTPQDLSPVHGVNKLLPAYYLTINSNHRKSIHSYWSYSHYFTKNIGWDEPIVMDHFNDLLLDSIAKRLPSQHPIGCFVSGGLGSGTVAYYLQQLVPANQIQAYTVGFQDENTADMQAAAEVTKAFHIPHRHEVITPYTFLNDLVKIVWYLDEPLADPNITATWRMSGLATPVNVVFSGMGSDEILAGHTRYTVGEHEIQYRNLIVQLAMPMIRQLFLPILKFFYQRAVFGILRKTPVDPWQTGYLLQNALFTKDDLAAAAPRLANLFDPGIFLHRFYNLPKITSPLASFMYLDVKTRLADWYILQYERLTAARDLEWRAPFLSRSLMEYLAGMPEPEHLTPEETFFILKALLKDVFPQSFINRPKKTRKDFLKPWVEESGLAQLFEILPKGTLVEQGIISETWLREHVSTPQKRRDSFRLLWGILILEIWVQLYINRPIQFAPPDISVHELITGK